MRRGGRRLRQHDVVDLDEFILGHWQELLDLFQGGTESLKEVLLRAQMQDLAAFDEQQALAWCQMARGRYLRSDRRSEAWMIAHSDTAMRQAFHMRAEGKDDAEIANSSAFPHTRFGPSSEPAAASSARTAPHRGCSDPTSRKAPVEHPSFFVPKIRTWVREHWQGQAGTTV